MLVRFDNLIPEEQLRHIQSSLATADFEDGRLTAGIDARSVKNNRQLPKESPLVAELGDAVLKRLLERPEVVRTLFPKRISAPLFSAYGVDMEYGLHVDNGVMGSPNGLIRSDIAMTLFLSDPDSYEGGDLVIADSGLGHHRVRLPAGSAFAYPATSLHRVDRVSRGTRLACVLWIQSQIRDSGQRRILVDLDVAMSHLRTKDANGLELGLVAAAYNNLLRQWTDL